MASVAISGTLPMSFFHTINYYFLFREYLKPASRFRYFFYSFFYVTNNSWMHTHTHKQPGVHILCQKWEKKITYFSRGISQIPQQLNLLRQWIHLIYLNVNLFSPLVVLVQKQEALDAGWRMLINLSNVFSLSSLRCGEEK